MTSQPFISVLANLATECDKLAGLAGEIDLALGQLALSEPGLDRNTRATLQQIDLLRQSLECISNYVEKLAKQVDTDLQVNPAAAAKELFLHDLARNLISAGSSEIHKSDPEISFF